MKNKRYIIPLLFILLVSATASPILSQTHICDYCGGQINGKFIKVENRYFHPEHFKCNKCNNPIEGSYFEAGGKYYDEECYKKHIQKRCGSCDLPINGEFIIFNDRSYHVDCYRNHIALKCDLCNGMIEGEYLTDYWGNSYHKHHQYDSDKCEYCMRFISDKLTGGGVKYPDGRKICGICSQSAINKETEAIALLERVSNRLAALGIYVDTKDVRLNLVDKNSMKRIAGEKEPVTDKRGFVHYSFSTLDGKIVDRNFDIYILNGLPYYQYMSVAAHELMHVWQYSNSPANNEASFCEGSCNYASYLILSDFFDDYAKYLIENLRNNQDPIYGEGFRRVEKLVEQKGRNTWLDYLKTHRGFPANY